MSNLIRGFIEGLRPVARLTVSEWAEQNRVLSSVSSAEPGRWSNKRVPYLVEIMNRMSPYDDAKRIVLMKGAQTGGTEAFFNAIGYYIDCDPCSMMYVMPTESTAKRNSKIRFDPMIEASPNLKKRIAPMRSRDKENSVLQKAFPGGVLIFAGANSPAPLRSVPVRIMILDELDAMPMDVGGEGSPVKLAEARTRTFAQKKVVLISTPTGEGESMIQQQYEMTGQRMLFVPCPHCGLFQVLEWEQMRWEPGRPHTAAYECCGCGDLIEERHKPFMLANGRFQATVPEKDNDEVVGYHISALYSPLGWYSWREAVQEFEDSEGEGKLNDRKVWTNTVLGLPYKESADKPEWEHLYNRRENYPTYCPPAPVILITCGVDVQKDRLELELVGWTLDKQSYSLDYRVLPGETSKTGAGSVWEDLRAVLAHALIREDGKIIPISRTVIDSGYNTMQVYSFVQSCDPRLVVAGKGSDTLKVPVSTPRPITYTPAGKPITFNGLWGIGSSMLKAQFYGRLSIHTNDSGVFPPQYCHFPTAYDGHYFRMLTAEVLKKRLVKGFPVYDWHKEYPRNEALDCRVYATAAMVMLGADRWTEAQWHAQEASYGQRTASSQEARRRAPKRSSFWDT